MKNGIRFFGIETVGNIPWGTHLCQFYQTKKDLIEILVPYFKAGLENNEFCIWITSESLLVKEIKEVLRRYIPNFDNYTQKGQIEIISHADWYLKEGNFDSQEILDRLIEKLNKALDNGYEGLRLSEEAFWGKDGLDSFVCYEEKLNSITDKFRIIALCTYSLEKCSAIDAFEIAANHDFALGKRKGKWERIKDSSQKNNAECKQEEYALSIEHARLRVTLDSMPAGVWIVDINGRILETNEQAKIIWGGSLYQPDSMAEYDKYEGWWPDTGEKLKAEDWAMSRALTTGEIIIGEEVNIRRFDGSFGTILNNASPIRNDKGQIIGGVVIEQDITEIKKTEKELKEANRALNEDEARLKLIIADSPDTIFEQDHNLRYIWIYNPASPYSPSDVIGKTDTDFLPPEQAQELETIKRRVLDAGSHEKAILELSPGGELRWYEAIFKPHYDADGKVIGVLSYTRDITERKKDEAEISHQREMLQKIFDNIPVLLVIWDPNLQRFTLNRHTEKVLSWTTADANDGDFMAKVYPDPDDCAKVSAYMVSLQSGWKEWIGTTKDGQHVPIEWANVFLTDDTMIGIGVDLRKRKKAEKALAEAYEELHIKSEELQSSNEELMVQSEELQAQTEELQEAYGALIESEKRYRMLFTNMTEAFFLAEIIYNRDGKPSDYRHLEINPAYELTTGIKKEQVLGRSALEVFSNSNLIAIEKFGRVALSGQPEHFEIFSQVANKYLEFYVFSPEKGKFAAIFRDVTERKKAEIALQASEEQYRAFFENSIDAVLLTSPDGAIYAANPAAQQIFGMAEEEIIQAGRNGIVDISDPKLKPALEERAKTGKFRGELNHKRKDGTIFPGEVSTSFFKDKNGLVKSVMIIRDITERKRAEDALRESQSRLEAVFTSIPDAVIEYDISGQPVRANEAALKAYGLYSTDLTRDKAVKKLKIAHIDGSPVKVDELPTSRALKGEVIAGELYRFTNAEGKELIITTYAAPLFKDNMVNGAVALWHDITELKRVEEALKKAHDTLEIKVKKRTVELENAYNSLKENEVRFRAYLENSAVIAWMKDEEGRYVFLSDNYKKRFGVNLNDWGGKTDLEIWPLEIAEKIRENDLAVLKGGENIEIIEETINPDGRTSWWLNNKFLFTDSSGKKYVGGLGVDLTDRVRAEKALQENEARFRNLFETIPSGVIIYDVIDNGRDFIFKDINPAGESIDHVRKEDIIGRSLYEFFPNVSEMGLDEVFRRVWLTGKSEFFPVTFYKDERIALWVTNHVYRLPSGELVAVFDDITQRKQTEEALEKINEIRIKEIHHRIKNNLQVISSLLDLQAETFSHFEVCKVPEVLEAFKESQNRVISMALIHEELYEGNESGNLDFAAYLRKLTDYLLNSYNIKTAGISLKLDFEQVYLDMDIAIPLGIIVNELVLNSLKHAFSNGKKREISITLHRKENFAINKENGELGSKSDNNLKDNNFCYMLTVADNGKGIPEEIDFQNAETLGLQLVNILVDQIDGCIELRRSQGTEFTILFSDIK